MAILVPLVCFISGSMLSYCIQYPFVLLAWIWGMFKYEEDKFNGISLGFNIAMVHDSNIFLLYQYCAPTFGRLKYVYNVSSKTLSR